MRMQKGLKSFGASYKNKWPWRIRNNTDKRAGHKKDTRTLLTMGNGSPDLVLTKVFHCTLTA